VTRPAYSGLNSSPVPETGSVVAAASTGSGPYAAAFDTMDQLMYVVNYDSDNITLLNGTSTNATITLPTYAFPDGIAYDPVNGTIYVALYGLSIVSVILNQTIIANISVGSEPAGVAYDSGNGWVYVADAGAQQVSVLNGTSLVATINGGPGPTGVTYDAIDDYVDVTNNQLNTVSFIRGTSVLRTASTDVSPQGDAFDPVTDLLYVANSGDGTVSVYEGNSRIATVPVGSQPRGVVYDPENGLVYVANSNSNTVSILNGTQVVGKIGVDSGPYAAAYDPAMGAVFVLNYLSDSASVVSTALGIGLPSVSPLGDPVGSADVQENVTFNATLWGIGAGGNNITVQVSPGPGLGCPSYVDLVLENGVGQVLVPCVPTAAGRYSIEMLVTDQRGNSVWSSIGFQVYPAPSAAVPLVRLQGEAESLTSSDVGQRLVFEEVVTGGTNLARPYNWSGLTPSNCSGLTTNEPVCTFPLPVHLLVSVAFNDSNGRKTTSAPLLFPVYTLPQATAPTVSPTRADVGQVVTFSEAPTGGPGSFQPFVWSGLPSTGGCVGVTTAHPRCTVTTAGINDVSVTVTDTNGISSTSPTAAFNFDPLPAPSTPTASRTSADTGQPVAFSTVVSGGSGGFSYDWSGLPSFGCLGTTTNAPQCRFATAGTFSVQVTVTDSNGGVSALSGATIVSVVPQPLVGTPILSPSTLAPGASLTVRVAVTGGAGGYQYAWVGLPPGCNSTTDTVQCSPSQVGSYAITVSVTDANGYSVNSSAAFLTIATTLPTLFGASVGVFYGSILAIVVVVVALLLVRRRRRVAAELKAQAEAQAVQKELGYRLDDPRLDSARRQRRP
jgi:YVTN family beta-propeller protein